MWTGDAGDNDLIACSFIPFFSVISFSRETHSNCSAFPYFTPCLTAPGRTAGDPHYFLAEWVLHRIGTPAHTCVNKTDDTNVLGGLV